MNERRANAALGLEAQATTHRKDDVLRRTPEVKAGLHRRLRRAGFHFRPSENRDWAKTPRLSDGVGLNDETVRRPQVQMRVGLRATFHREPFDLVERH